MEISGRLEVVKQRAYRHPIVSLSTLSTHSRRCGARVRQWSDGELALDLCRVGEIAVIVVVLRERLGGTKEGGGEERTPWVVEKGTLDEMIGHRR
jgi:hypothetical protein